MGYEDRDYYRGGPQRPVSRFADIPVVKWLLISNIGVFVLGALLTERGQENPLALIGMFSIQTALQEFQVWRFLTFQFLHSGFLHLLFNMWALFIFGPFLERAWRSKAFLWYYLICGVSGALLYTLLVFLPGGLLPSGSLERGMVGASAGIFGILVGVAVLAPRAQIQLLFPPIKMTMRTFALVFLALDVFLLVSNSSNAGGSAGHLGGALVGFLFMKVPFLRSGLLKLANRQGRPRVPKPKARGESKLRPRSELSRDESSEVDRILDKINQEGLQSLTDKEREFLKRTSGG